MTEPSFSDPCEQPKFSAICNPTKLDSKIRSSHLLLKKNDFDVQIATPNMTRYSFIQK